MKAISIKTAHALLNYKKTKTGNTLVWQDHEGSHMTLFGNKIAWVNLDGELWITDCGWVTPTTRDRLSAILRVPLNIRKGAWLLDGEHWDGSPKLIRTQVEKPSPSAKANTFIESTEWVKFSGGWRGANQPVYAVVGANDTGTWVDSPCRTEVADAELDAIASHLAKKGINTKHMICEGSNVFCQHRYLITYPHNTERARQLVEEYLDSNETRLLYSI
jgi:hypothetical protein